MKSPHGWALTNVSDVCEAIIDCVNRTAPTVNYVTPYKMIRTTNIKKGYIDTTEVKYVTGETYKRWSRRGELRRKDIILTREAPLGEVGMIRADDTIFMGQRLVMYRANPDVLVPEFLLYAMQERLIQGQIRAFGSGATVEHMRVPDARALRILLPPFEKQQKIAAILSAYDELIENNLRRIKLLEEVAHDLYQEWFVNFRFQGHAQVEVDKGGKVAETIPSGWYVSKLFEEAEVTYGYAFKSGNFSNTPVGMPIVRIRDIKSNSSNTYTSEKADPKYLIEDSGVTPEKWSRRKGDRLKKREASNDEQ